MPFPKAPKIVYNAGVTTLTLTQSATGWNTDKELIGGQSVSGAGIPETYIVRKQPIQKVTLKFTEAELAAVVAWLDFVIEAGSLGSFDFYPDQTVVGTFYTCYLLKPTANGRYEVKRDATNMKYLQLDI